MATEKVETTTASWLKEAQKGYIRIGVLILLSTKPAHGYELMKEIKDKTGGFYKPTPGGVYPILRDLEKSGYIKGEWHKIKNRKIKTYGITDKGKVILRNAIVKQTEIANNINSLFQQFARDVLNIEPTAVQMPVMPNPFAAFLEKENKKTVSKEELKSQRKQLKEHIGMMQKKLKSVNEELERIKKAKKEEPDLHLD
jgi:DNA-binding PadR family transcriptional regulator